MDCIIETVSEFTYLENLLMGLSNALKKCLGVHQTFLRKLPLATPTDISTWEQTQGVQMPSDLREFYCASNGFVFEWIYNSDEDKVSGSIKINPLQDLIPIFGFETSTEPGVTLDTKRYQIKLSIESRLFILDTIPHRGHVVLVYLYPKYLPTIWLLTVNMTLYFLANDIAAYLRMAISNLGIPNWQFIYTAEGVPQWTENVFRLFAPHLLPLNKSIENLNREREEQKSDNCSEILINKLDTNLFKLCPSTTISNIISSRSEKSIPKKRVAYKSVDQVYKSRLRMHSVKKNPK